MITIAQRVFGVPLLLHSARAVELAHFVSKRQGFEMRAKNQGGPTSHRDQPYAVIDGIARLPIGGMLVHKSSWLDAPSGLTGYDHIRSMFDEAVSNPRIRGIALMVNSPGGEIAGMFDLADRIYEARAAKPIWSILDETAYSAAYALASSAEVVTVPRTGGTGSIGALAVHAEHSRALDKVGVTVTLMRYGDRKARANDLEPLQDEDRAELQADIDRIGEEFVALVARNRNISARAVRDQQAATFMGELGVENRLADIVASPDEAFRVFQGALDQIQGPASRTA